jgi:hypothetical protein
MVTWWFRPGLNSLQTICMERPRPCDYVFEMWIACKRKE